jgi:hypothetical protein
VLGTPEATRLRGTHSRRWEDNTKVDIRELGWGDRTWIHMAQDEISVGSCEDSNETSR